LARSKIQDIIQIDQQVSTIDIAPTLIDVLGVQNQATQQYEGASLLPIMLGEDKLNRTVFAETEYRYVTNLESVQTGDKKKLIKNKLEHSSLLFDVATDPNEAKNLVADQPKLLTDLEKVLFSKIK
jgi:arylsulfatase A-like enzyme